MNKARIDKFIEDKKKFFISVSDEIWEYAETRFQEYKSANLLCTILEAEGFTIEKGLADMDTAFSASFGKGKPVVAILGEYDALSGMNQQQGVARKTVANGKNGHACGHNLLGAGALAAAVAVKNYIEEHDIQGTIRYYGCPGEEGGSGKAFMARAGVFADVDIFLTWHPFTYNTIMSISTLANYQVAFKFHGKSAHAAAAPHLGRSALDAVELMNIGVNYLREHIIPEARVHYAVTNSGGLSPNVVQAEAEVLYLIRAPKLQEVQEIYERVCDIAEGAALMTGTEPEIVFNKACSNYIPNETLEKLLYENFQQVGAPQLSEADKQFATEIKGTLGEMDINSDLQMVSKFIGGKRPEIIGDLKEKVIADTLLPYVYSATLLPGSTDVGDVSWLAPTAQFAVACNVFGTPGHSWQTVAQGTAGFAHQGMLIAGKVLARTAVEVLLNQDVVLKAKAELEKNLEGSVYVCPIPPEVKPSPLT